MKKIEGWKNAESVSEEEVDAFAKYIKDTEAIMNFPQIKKSVSKNKWDFIDAKEKFLEKLLSIKNMVDKNVKAHKKER